MRWAATIAILVCACGDSDTESNPDASVTPDATTGAPDASSLPDAAIAAATCPPGTYATAVAANGDLTCATIDDALAVAVRSRCSVYLGHRDSCDDCEEPPAKWSRSGPLACSPGDGNGNTCVSAVLDDPASPVRLATLDLDGDVNGDDKLFTTLHCVTAPRAQQPAPCAPGWAIAGRSGSRWMCTPVSEIAVDHVRSQCSVYLGWQDRCDDCTSAPTKWGVASDAGCISGAGDDNTCVTATLAGETVNLFGLNTDGDVNDDDTFYVGLSCGPAADQGTASTSMCPAGELMVGINADGTTQCAGPATKTAEYIDASCSLVLGWRDSCDACTQAPSKWGKAGTTSCATGAGDNNTCLTATLDSATVDLFGLNTDGDVNDDDTLYLGLHCGG